MRLRTLLMDLFYPPTCFVCGGTVPNNMPPPGLKLCRNCQDSDLWQLGADRLTRGVNFTRCVCAGWYRDGLRKAIHRFKFEKNPGLARDFGPLLARVIREELDGQYDLLSWVPVSAKTLKTRGYDQARLLAEAAGKQLGKAPVSTLAKTRNTQPQSSLEHGADRWTNVEGVYSVPRPDLIAGKRVLLIDDVLTTGATLESAAGALLEAGAAEVVAATFCRTPKK